MARREPSQRLLLAGLLLILTLGLNGSIIDMGRQEQYQAELEPLNTQVTGTETRGRASFQVDGDSLTILIEVEGAPPEIEHWQHFHGFTDGRSASCPPPEADANGDGVIDLIETEPYSGVTMVPFNADPAALAVESATYPVASSKGTYSYQTTVSLPALQAAFAREFEGQSIDLERRVVYIHGIPEGTELPTTVQSLGDIPAHVTLPIACGRIERVPG